MINMDFTGQFPPNGFYVVIKAFNTENLIFKRGDIVALKKYGNKNVRINLTGPQAAYCNYMRVEKIPHLRELTPDEVSLLTNDAIIPDEAFAGNSMGALVTACRLITKPHGFITTELIDDDTKRLPNCNINGKIPKSFKEYRGQRCFWICYNCYQIFVPYTFTSELKIAQQICDQICLFLKDIAPEDISNLLYVSTDIQIDHKELTVDLLFSSKNILVKRKN